jgi:hypothetical protein
LTTVINVEADKVVRRLVYFYDITDMWLEFPQSFDHERVKVCC